MGVRIEAVGETGADAVLVDSTTDWAIAAIFRECEVCDTNGTDLAQEFLDYLEGEGCKDVRNLSNIDLSNALIEFAAQHQADDEQKETA